MTFQKKMIALFLLLGFVTVFQRLVFTASMVDGVDGDCAPGTDCARPWRMIETPIFSFEANDLSHEQFEVMRIVLIAVTFGVQLVGVVTLSKTLKSSKESSNTADLS